MLTAVRADWGVAVPAWTIDRAAGPFACPECRADVTLRKGSQRVHHFAHRADAACTYGAGETEAHRACKRALYEALHARAESGAEVGFARMEWAVGRQRADVFAEIRGERVAFEVQVSALAPEDLARRTAGYARAGVAVCWLHPYESSERGGIGAGLEAGTHNPKQWERWIHAANAGRSYYWRDGLLVQPVHFAPLYREVEERTWRDRGGWLRSGGGYSKLAKLARTPLPGRLAHLVRDFGVIRQSASTRDGVRIPKSDVFRDGQPDWWPA